MISKMSLKTRKVKFKEMVGLSINDTKDDRINDIKRMIVDYNSQLTRFKPRTEEDFEKDARMFIRLASRNMIKNYLDFIHRPVSHGKYPEKGVLTSIDSIVKYEPIFIEEYCLKLIQNPELQVNLEQAMSRVKIGIINLKELKDEENAFYYLLDRKISERIGNKTVYYCDLPSRSEAYENFRQIKQALEDVENEYEATGVGIFERLEIIERERLKRVYDKLEKREAESIEKLRQLKIKMLTPTPKENAQVEEANHNGITYKRCNDCGAWHNAQYNRCAPCNDFSAKNDR